MESATCVQILGEGVCIPDNANTPRKSIYPSILIPAMGK